MSAPVKTEQPIVGEGVIFERPATNRDPFESLDDLMTVIEALCPIWPDRKTFSSSGRFLL